MSALAADEIGGAGTKRFVQLRSAVGDCVGGRGRRRCGVNDSGRRGGRVKQ